MTFEEQLKQDRKICAQTDGHYCYDWDDMAVSAWATEYDCCSDYPKSRLGRLINWLVMLRFDLCFWWRIGRHRKEFHCGSD